MYGIWHRHHDKSLNNDISRLNSSRPQQNVPTHTIETKGSREQMDWKHMNMCFFGPQFKISPAQDPPSFLNRYHLRDPMYHSTFLELLKSGPTKQLIFVRVGMVTLLVFVMPLACYILPFWRSWHWTMQWELCQTGMNNATGAVAKRRPWQKDAL